MFRTMPNTPVIVQNGVTIHTAGSHVTDSDKDLLQGMLSSVGIGMEMREHYLDIMTALSGGGPSFVSYPVLLLCNVSINVTVYGKRGHFTQKLKLRYRLQK